MKKKLLCVTLSAVLALSMVGCGLFGVKNDAPVPENAPSKAPSEDTAKSEETKADEPAKEQEKKPFTNDGIILVNPYRYNMTTLYVFNEDGSLIDTYDLEPISEKLKESENEDYSYLTYCDGIFFFSGYKYEDGDSYKKLVAYDSATGEITDVIYWGSDNIYDVEAYDGKLTCSLSTSDYSSWTVKSFEKDEDSLTFREASPKYSDIYDQISTYNITNIERGCSLEHFLDKNGGFVARNDDKYYLVKTDGSIEELTCLQDNFYSLQGNAKYACFTEYDDSYKTVGTFCIDLSTGEKKKLSDLSIITMGFENGIFYFAEKEDTEFNVFDITIKSYNTATDELNTLFEKESVPATEMFEPVVTGFTLNDNKVFYTDIDEGKVKIYCADLADGKVSNETCTDLVTQSFTPYDFGTVEYRTVSSYCPNCGIPLTQAYAETFVLDPKFSEHADEINASLKQHSDNFIGEYETPKESWLGEDEMNNCEGHQEYPEQYDMTDTDQVENVGMIDDHYLFIDKTGYWYGGGAHGMPSRDQLLYDLTTGNELKITDFYKGSLEDYKALVAQKTKEDYESYAAKGVVSPYFAENSQEVYDTAYESVQLDMNVYFREDGIIYYFYPYEMGSYADGFRDIFISYKDLLGRDTLSE